MPVTSSDSGKPDENLTFDSSASDTNPDSDSGTDTSIPSDSSEQDRSADASLYSIPASAPASTPKTSTDSLAPPEPQKDDPALPLTDVHTHTGQKGAPTTETESFSSQKVNSSSATAPPLASEAAAPPLSGIKLAPDIASPSPGDVEPAAAEDLGKAQSSKMPGEFPSEPPSGVAQGTAHPQTSSVVSVSAPSRLERGLASMSTRWQEFKSKFRSPSRYVGDWKREHGDRQRSKYMKRWTEATDGLSKCYDTRDDLLKSAWSRQTKVSGLAARGLLR